MRVLEIERENWHFFVTCLRCPQNCKASFGFMLTWQERLTNVQKWNMHVQSVQFLRQCVGHFFIPTPSLPPRFSLTTCSSFLPFSFVSRNNFNEGIFRDVELVGRLKYNSSILGHQFSLSSFRSVFSWAVRQSFSVLFKVVYRRNWWIKTINGKWPITLVQWCVKIADDCIDKC